MPWILVIYPDLRSVFCTSLFLENVLSQIFMEKSVARPMKKQLRVEITPLTISNSFWILLNSIVLSSVSRHIKSLATFNARLTVQFPIENKIIWIANSGDFRYFAVSFNLWDNGSPSGWYSGFDIRDTRGCGTFFLNWDFLKLCMIS